MRPTSCSNQMSYSGKSAYKMVAAPAAAILLSALNTTGSGSKAARNAAMLYLTSNSAAVNVTDALAGPAGKKPRKTAVRRACVLNFSTTPSPADPRQVKISHRLEVVGVVL